MSSMLGVAAARVCVAGESNIVVYVRGCLCYPGMVVVYGDVVVAPLEDVVVVRRMW
jgi:hypothetical protein